MVSAEELKRDNMYYEAVDRMELMGADYKDRWMVLMNRAVECKVVVNHEELSVKRVEIDDAELKMIRNFEKQFNFIVYYMIQDEGKWPDGCTFKRITLLFVDEHEEEYEMVREDCIKNCGTIPAYVINLDEPECSEITEMVFRNVEGLLINAS